MNLKTKHGYENRRIAGTVPAVDWKIEWEGHVSVPIVVAEKLDARIARLRAALERITTATKCGSAALEMALDDIADIAAAALKGDA
jgi:hypothetical protein